MSEPDAGTDAKARTWGAGDYSQIASRLVPVSERLCEAVDLRAGRTVLDVASGHGNTALAAARQSAVVKAIDITEPLLEQGVAPGAGRLVRAVDLSDAPRRPGSKSSLGESRSARAGRPWTELGSTGGLLGRRQTVGGIHGSRDPLRGPG